MGKQRVVILLFTIVGTIIAITLGFLWYDTSEISTTNDTNHCGYIDLGIIGPAYFFLSSLYAEFDV